ncbi:MAG: hypothetical protein PF637_10875 [Spirochaetes bacterium]|jgi:hypothetical protein|nr:hypothetical protein [Spirochaetota bacterium]
MIDTTITMESNRLIKLLNLCIKAGITKNRFIILCLNKYIPKMKRTRYKFTTKKYQDRAPDWENVHLYIHPATFEKYNNIISFQKYTLSLLAALAIDKYGEEVLESIFSKRSQDNEESFSNYFSVFCDKKYGKVTFVSIWDKTDIQGAITIEQIVHDKDLILDINDW